MEKPKMGQRHQRGWLKKETRGQGETWVLFYRTTRKSDGKRVENKIRIGLVKQLPEISDAWAKLSDYTSQSIRWIRGEASRSAIWLSTTLSMNWSTTRNQSMPKRTRQCDPTNE